MRLLIANRGEIARRVIRTAHALGHDTVAVYADPDAGAPHVREATTAVRIGPADLSRSYLSIDAVVAAAVDSGADAVHPGYGLLSENAAFARAVLDAGLTWVGPHPEAIESMGSKIEARRLAIAAGVPVVPGFEESQDPAELRAAADRIGYPVLVKAAAGGGGRGIRRVHSPDEFDTALASAKDEARRTFGDDAVIVERFVQRPRHVEVQVVGDRHGRVVELGTRECSVQRRYQKVVEEAPAPNLPDETRAGLRSSAVALAEAIGYDNAGTVEFIVDDDTGEHFFLEMNTRLQVEHPVTEQVTGVDLVEWQLRVADGEHLPADVPQPTGHAIEARINAEDATAGFAPQTGTITDLVVPTGVRWDAAVEQGTTVSPHYDSMIAKLIVDGPDRDTALRRLRGALDRLIVGGVVTNTGLHRWLVDQPPVRDARVTTNWLDATELPGPADEAAAAREAARAWVTARRATAQAGPWTSLPGFRVVPHAPSTTLVLEGRTDDHEVPTPAGDEQPTVPATVDLGDRRVAVNHGGTSFVFTVPDRTHRWAPAGAIAAGRDGALAAPFPGVVAEVQVAVGDDVEADAVVVTLEAMKMLNPLHAPATGTVTEVRVEPGDQVDGQQVLLVIDPHDGRPEGGDHTGDTDV